MQIMVLKFENKSLKDSLNKLQRVAFNSTGLYNKFKAQSKLKIMSHLNIL